MCRKGTARKDCHTGPYFKVMQAASCEPWQAMVELHCGGVPFRRSTPYHF